MWYCYLSFIKDKLHIEMHDTLNSLEVVPIIGVEPTTFALRMRCSTN